MSATSLASLDAWLAREREGLRRFARALVKGDADAEDCVQEASLAALRAEAPASRGAWMRTVVRRLAFRRHREAGRRRRREEAAARPEAVAPVEEAAERFDLHRRVLAAVDGLAEPYRSTVLLRYVQGLSVAETAKVQGESVAATKTRLHRALDTIRADLDRSHAGGRSAWAPVLLALGGIAVGHKTAIVGTALLLLLGGGAAWWGLRGEEIRREEAPAAPIGDAAAPTLTGAERPKPEPAATTVASTVLREGDAVPGATFAGRVVDAAGAGVAGADVRLHWMGTKSDSAEAANGWHLILRRERERRERPSTRTDAEGYFRLDRPYGSTSWLRVDATGFVPRVSGPHGSGEFVTVRLEAAAGGGGLRVRVTDDTGAAVAEAEVRLATQERQNQFPPVPREVFAVVRTDREGRAVLPSAPEGLGLEVVPDRPDLGTVERLLRTGETDVEVRLPAAKVMTRVVVDAETLAPLADAWVDLLRSGESYASPSKELRRRRVLADSAGRVRYPWQDGYYGAYAGAPGHEVVHAWEDPLRLPRAMRVEGTVTDEEGRPVAGAAVLVAIPDAGTYDAAYVGDSPVAGWSGEDGRYAVELRLPHAAHGKEPPDRGVRSIIAVHPDPTSHAAAVVDGVRVVAGGRDVVDLRLPRAATLDVEVVDAEGKPIADQWLGVGRLVPRGETWPVPDRPFGLDLVGLGRSRSLKTDAAGRCLVDGLSPGRHLLYAESSRTEADAREGETTRVRLVMGAGPSIRGRVVSASGAPVARATVSLGGPAAAGKTADDEGRFSFLDLPDGEYGVSAFAPGSRWHASARARPGDDVTLRIPAGPARLRIRLEGPPEGTAQYSLWTMTGGVVPDGTGFVPLPKDGFETPEFVPGRGALVVQAPGYGWTVVSFDAPEQRTTEVTVSLQKAGALDVVLGDDVIPPGTDRRRVLVRLDRADRKIQDAVGDDDPSGATGGAPRLAYAVDRSRGSVKEHATVGKDGVYTFADVTPGPYELSVGSYVDRKWVAHASRRVEILSGETENVTLR